MRIFGSDRISPLLGKLGMEEDMPIEHRLITKAIENAQTRVEAHNFDIRKYLLEYDNVMNKQRETIYGMRKEIIEDGDMRERIVELVDEIVEGFVDEYAPEKVYPEEWDIESLKNRIYETFFFRIDLGEMDFKSITKAGLLDKVRAAVMAVYEAKEKEFGETLRNIEQYIALSSLDTPLEGAPPFPRPPAGGHRPARLRAEGPLAGVPEGELRPFPRYARQGQPGHGAEALRHPAGAAMKKR